MLNNTETVISMIENMAMDSGLQNIQFGLFGSYARNQQSSLSDIDIVLKGTGPLLLVYDGIEEKVKEYIREKLNLDCDVVDYADLEADYEEAKELGIEEFTLKSEVDKEVIWIS